MARQTKKELLENMEAQMKDDIRWSIKAFVQGEMIEAVGDYKSASTLSCFIKSEGLFVSHAREVAAQQGVEYSVWFKAVSRAYSDSLDETIRKINAE
jgi:hypothetical protein